MGCLALLLQANPWPFLVPPVKRLTRSTLFVKYELFSGAGKSTLLDILASRVNRRAFSGSLKVNGEDDIKYE